MKLHVVLSGFSGIAVIGKLDDSHCRYRAMDSFFQNVHGQLYNVKLFFYDFLRSRYNTYKATSFMFAFYHFKHVDLEKETKEN